MTDRQDAPLIADEREMLAAWLDWQRATLERKCRALSGDDLRRRAVEPSTLSLLGLVRHLAEVERSWFRRNIAGEQIGQLYASGTDADAAFAVEAADVEEAFGTWRDECERSRGIVAAAPSLDVTGTSRAGNVISLRWVLIHMIEEYARHNGHADLIRERIDGETGK